MKISLKQKILVLLKQGKSYPQIKRKLRCAESTISYHSKRSGIKSKHLIKTLTKQKLHLIKNFYKEHSRVETSKKFKISVTTISRHFLSPHPRILLSQKERRERNYFLVKNRRKRIKSRAVEYKGGKCEICKYSKCIQALEFHHKKPKTKDFSLSGTRTYASWNKIKKELNKCTLVCSNCHREIHAALVT